MHAELPLVSVVTPSLDQGAYIEEAIRSVLEQDYPRIEHIVVDGCSTDQTLEILRRHPHLRWTSEPDSGQAEAINKGFRMAAGEILGWLNADDYLLPGAIAAAVDALQRTGAALVHGGWRRIDETGKVLGDVPAVPFDLRRQLERANVVCQPGAFFTRDAYWAVGGVDESYRYAMDYELWLKLGARFPICHVDRVQAAYRYHERAKSVAEYDGFGPETVRASRAHGGRFLSPMYVDHYLPRWRPNVYRLLLAYRLLRSGSVGALLRRTGARALRVGHRNR
jgi:glycosyltransferase involved in cell wall biosynthesis